VETIGGIKNGLPWPEAEDRDTGYAITSSTTPFPSTHKMRLQIYRDDDDDFSDHPNNERHPNTNTSTHDISRSPSLAISSSHNFNVLRPLSVNTTQSQQQYSRKSTRSLSIMDRGRPVRKSSGACWPGVGREKGTEPAEEWRKENRPVAGVTLTHSHYWLDLRHL
jgi:hypothetical protein